MCFSCPSFHRSLSRTQPDFSGVKFRRRGTDTGAARKSRPDLEKERLSERRARCRHIVCVPICTGDWASGGRGKHCRWDLPVTSKMDMGVFCNSQKLNVACLCDSCYCMRIPWPSKSLPLWAKTELWAWTTNTTPRSSLFEFSRQVAGTLFAVSKEPYCLQPPRSASRACGMG